MWKEYQANTQIHHRFGNVLDIHSQENFNGFLCVTLIELIKMSKMRQVCNDKSFSKEFIIVRADDVRNV